MKTQYRGEMIFSTGINALSAGLNFVMQIIIIRLFGVAVFGAFSFWRNNIYIAGSIGRFGLQSLALKELPLIQDSGERATLMRFYRFSLIAWLAVSLAVIAGFVVSGQSSRSGAYDIHFAVAGLALAGSMIGVAVFRVIGSLRLSILLDRLFILLFFLGFLGVAAATGYTGEPVLFLAFTLAVVAGFVLTIVAVILSHRKMVARFSPASSGGSEDEDRPWGKTVWNFFALAIGNILAQRSTLFVSGLFLGALDLGRIAFMIMLAGLISLPLTALNQVAAPNISRASAKGEYNSIRSIIAQTRLFSVVLGVAAAVIIFFGSGLIEAIAGKTGLVEPSVLALLLAAMAINAWFGPVGTALSMIGQEKNASIILNVAVALKLAALFAIIPLYGLIGIGVIEIVFTLGWNFAMAVQLKRQTRKWTTG